MSTFHAEKGFGNAALRTSVFGAGTDARPEKRVLFLPVFFSACLRRFSIVSSIDCMLSVMAVLAATCVGSSIACVRFAMVAGRLSAQT
ncbi:hypothetical protein GAO09_02645 [Rhizobiales bacterium RZME27]|jgi:hypothetical protein|uniref:Uncharacterized protein n=1 Tax=Endobacterium cereale TaxID=2663029 RepID=A0A6A8A1U0_9HYPH|nr:hypothetical protein [Endobacterium cereale]MEB2845060.1 hypothetical protein [Endobacterium cereale]MQY44972.1 hypothetical protein [Endobacterium cereale]